MGWSSLLTATSPLKASFVKTQLEKKKKVFLSSVSALLVIIFRSFRNDYFVFVDMLK